MFRNCKTALAFLQDTRYNSHVKYFEVFLICFINSDNRKYFMEIRNLITFTKVAETQSLSKAAKVLGYAQSTVTMQMQQLEQELGTQLYERVGKQIRITQTGQEFLSYAAAIVRMSEDALLVGKQDTSTVSGSLRLGIFSPLAGPRISAQIAQYLQKYPQVNLHTETIPDPEQLLSRLRHNEVDLALTLDTRYTGEDLIHAGEDQPVLLCLYVSKEHPLARRHGLTPEDLSLYPLIRTGYFESGHESFDFTFFRQVNIFDPGLALYVAANASLGAQNSAETPDSRSPMNAMILVPELIVRQHSAADVLVPLDYKVSGTGIFLQTLYHRNKWLSGPMKAWLSDLNKPFA